MRQRALPLAWESKSKGVGVGVRGIEGGEGGVDCVIKGLEELEGASSSSLSLSLLILAFLSSSSPSRYFPASTPPSPLRRFLQLAFFLSFSSSLASWSGSFPRPPIALLDLLVALRPRRPLAPRSSHLVPRAASRPPPPPAALLSACCLQASGRGLEWAAEGRGREAALPKLRRQGYSGAKKKQERRAAAEDTSLSESGIWPAVALLCDTQCISWQARGRGAALRIVPLEHNRGEEGR